MRNLYFQFRQIKVSIEITICVLFWLLIFHAVEILFSCCQNLRNRLLTWDFQSMPSLNYCGWLMLSEPQYNISCISMRSL